MPSFQLIVERRCGESTLPERFFRPRPHARHQVPNDQDVDCGHNQLRDREVPRQFVEFQRDKQAGCHDCEIFRPMFLQQQAEAFREEQPGVKESAHTELFELFRRDAKDPDQDSVNVSAVRVHSQHLGPMQHCFGQVLVQEFDGADPDGDEQRRFQQLKQPDEN